VARKQDQPFNAEEFETFRLAYPASRRVGGKAAQRAFATAMAQPNVTLDVLLTAVDQHKLSEQWQDARYVPLLTTWLNQFRWQMVLPPSAKARLHSNSTCPHDPMCATRRACIDKILTEGRK
jgi:hypothetical protein